MKYLLVLLLLSGCMGTKPPPILPMPTMLEPVIIHPELPRPVSLIAPEFFVLTRDNVDGFFDKEQISVVFAVDTDGYETLSNDIQELRRYIVEVQNVIIFYKESLKKRLTEESE